MKPQYRGDNMISILNFRQWWQCVFTPRESISRNLFLFSMSLWLPSQCQFDDLGDRWREKDALPISRAIPLNLDKALGRLCLGANPKVLTHAFQSSSYVEYIWKASWVSMTLFLNLSLNNRGELVRDLDTYKRSQWSCGSIKNYHKQRAFYEQSHRHDSNRERWLT